MSKYTAKQIEESIAHWKNVLAQMNESKKIHSTRVDHATKDGSWEVVVQYDCGDSFHEECHTGFDSREAAKKHEADLLKGITEASYGGQMGYSNPDDEPPTQQQMLNGLSQQDDDTVADLFISILNEIGTDDDNLKKILMNLEDQDMLADFFRTFIASMSDQDYKKYVQVLY